MKNVNMTIEWLEEQIECELECGNYPQSARDFALLSMAKHELMKRHGMGAAPMPDHHEKMTLTREMADRWVSHMRNVDGTRGARWAYDEIAAKAAGFGIMPQDVLEFWVVVNMIRSDYGEVAKMFGVDHADFYAAMAKAWMEDEDAVENKTMLYKDCIVK